MPPEGPDEVARKQRALLRGHMTARVISLGEAEDAATETTPEERIELVGTLSAAAWAMTGLPWPTLPRNQWPIRVRNLGEPA